MGGRFVWEWDDMVCDLSSAQGRIVPKMAEETEEVEKDQYAEIADRGPGYTTAHHTAMSGGNEFRGGDLAESERGVEKACSPQGNEGQEKFMDRCIREKSGGRKSPGGAADQCYAIWHSSKGTSRKSQDEEMVKKTALLRLVWKGAINLAGMFVRKSK